MICNYVQLFLMIDDEYPHKVYGEKVHTISERTLEIPLKVKSRKTQVKNSQNGC